MPHRLIMLGATGDLTARYLAPALAALHENGHYPADRPVLGVGADEWDAAGFRDHLAERLGRHAGQTAGASRRAVAAAFEYRRADVTDPAALARLVDDLAEAVIRRGGRVAVLPADRMPTTTGATAVFRF